MKISRLAWKNFKGLADGEILADSNDVIIRGQNGVGKSSIAEILPFILFGELSGSIKRFDNGFTVNDRNITHAAEVTFDDQTTLRREVVSAQCGNKSNFFINGNAVKASEFKAHVGYLTNGGGLLVFNPFAFTTLPPDKQRAFLLNNFAGELPFSDDELNTLDGLSPDVFIAKIKTELIQPQNEVAYIPHRIDELNRQLADAPTDLEQQIEQLKAHIGKLQFERDNLQISKQNPSADFEAAVAKLDALHAQIASVKDRLDFLNPRRLQLLDDYRKLKAAKPGTCPTCGQPIPPDKFEHDCKAKIAIVVADGKKVAAQINSCQSDLARLNTELRNAKKLADDLKVKADAFAQADSNRIANLKIVNEQLDAANQQLASLKKATAIKQDTLNLIAREKELHQLIAHLNGQLHWAKDLRQRQIEDTEQTINSHFEHVNFKLFNLVSSTGELKPTCEPMLHGVPFQALSKGEKLKAALDIFCAIQNLFTVQLPLLIDDAESYTRNSLAALPNQLWLFKVSDEPQLVIDVQKAGRS